MFITESSIKIVVRCIFSFVEMYKKLEVNMPELRPVSEADKLTLAEGLCRIAKENGLDFKKTPHKGNRAGCLCMESRGLGDYNSCPNGCRYCYANKDHNKALQNYLTHDPKSPLLLGHLQPTDKIQPSRQVSKLNLEPSLF